MTTAKKPTRRNTRNKSVPRKPRAKSPSVKSTPTDTATEKHLVARVMGLFIVALLIAAVTALSLKSYGEELPSVEQKSQHQVVVSETTTAEAITAPAPDVPDPKPFKAKVADSLEVFKVKLAKKFNELAEWAKEYKASKMSDNSLTSDGDSVGKEQPTLKE